MLSPKELVGIWTFGYCTWLLYTAIRFGWVAKDSTRELFLLWGPVKKWERLYLLSGAGIGGAFVAWRAWEAFH